MTDLIPQLTGVAVSLDEEAMEVTQALRWAPLTALLTIASLWWVKGPVIAALGACGDCRAAIGGFSLRRLLPPATVGAGLAFLVASGLNALLKAAFERPRPPLADGELTASVALPGSHSFPSGHAMTAFAAATAVAALRPSLRWPALGLATVIAVSRPYLGVHYWTDVVAGAALGAIIGLAVAILLRRAARALCGDCPTPAAGRDRGALPGG